MAIDYLQCVCGHRKFRHYHGETLCDDCDCREFRTDLSVAHADTLEPGDMCVVKEPLDDPEYVAARKGGGTANPSHNGEVEGTAANNRGAAESKPVIVGYQWHNFQGSGQLCSGRISNTKEICNKPRNATIHSEEQEPQWMKDKEAEGKLPDSGLKDSGQRIQFESGMVRDVEDNKPGFHFMIPKDVPLEHQMLTRVAEHLRKGAKKYTPRNWEKGDSDDEAERARESAFRHMFQWITGETDEDHAAAVITNIIFAETMQYKANKKKEV